MSSTIVGFLTYAYIYQQNFRKQFLVTSSTLRDLLSPFYGKDKDFFLFKIFLCLDYSDFGGSSSFSTHKPKIKLQFNLLPL